MKKVLAILSAVCLILTVFGSCSKQTAIKYTANEDVLNIFKDTMKPEDVLKEVKNIDLYYEMNTEGLTEDTIEDKDNDTAIVTFKDKDGNIVYEKYEGYSEKGFNYYTKSLSGDDLKVAYFWGFYENDSQRDVTITSSDYSVSFQYTDTQKPYGAQYVSITVNGKESGLLQDNITYSLEDERWFVSASYLSDDGVHSYITYANDSNEMEEYDSLLFTKKNDFDVMDLSTMIDFTKDSGSKFEMKICGAPFFSDNGDNVKWYFDGDLQFILDTTEEANAFADEFGGESECMGDDVDGYYYVVAIANSGIAVSSEYTDFDPYNYTDINDYYSVVPELNENNEIIGLSYGTISYY